MKDELKYNLWSDFLEEYKEYLTKDVFSEALLDQKKHEGDSFMFDVSRVKARKENYPKS